jgi:hypothetical protein
MFLVRMVVGLALLFVAGLPTAAMAQQPFPGKPIRIVVGFPGYGPITPGDQGLKYFSLRASADETGAQFLATNMHKMRKLPKRHAVTPAVVPSEPEALAARTEPQIDTVLQEDDGLGVFMLRVPPNATLRAPDPAQTGGQSMIVAAGELLHGGASLDRWSCLHLSPDEAALKLLAGSCGAEVLVAQFPRPRAA